MSNLEKLRQKKVVEERGYGYELIPAIGKDLQGLLGFATVLHELIQNADDAKATSFEIDICDDIFYVGNNAIFTDKNFENISKTQSPASKARSTGTELQEAPSDDQAHQPSAPSAIEKSLPKKPKNNQPQKRFKSFVYAEREKQENEERQASTTQQTDLCGMKLAMEYELSQGRIPDDSPSRDKGCGYDIESRSADGAEVRLIELKTTLSFWQTRGVTMTPNEFQKAMRLGDKYWLYVIENLNKNLGMQPRLYRIQNLEDNIQSIVFDGGWKDVAELDDESSS
jgi:hypothetical protein